MFLKSSIITGETATNSWSAYIFDDDNDNLAMDQVADKKWLLFSPVNKELRKRFIQILNTADNNGRMNRLQALTLWNMMIPFSAILIVLIISIYKGDRIIILMLGTVILKCIIIMLAEPAAIFMYWLSAYLTGYVCLFYGIIPYILKNKVIIRKQG